MPGLTIALCAMAIAALSLCARSELTAPIDVTTSEQPTAALWTIDLNRAAVSEFDLLPGVGPARAALIVDLRTTRQGLTVVDDLRAVSGIGPIAMHRIRPWVRCSPIDRSSSSASSTVVNAVAR
ncbi:MAG: helix-hairpin-helix domain-containing protein [Phycisphaerales bacterium]|nr:helix-hairpin-helix domain-containing protein [Phycisphaerales bacterium]